MAFNAGAVEGSLELDTRQFVGALQRATKSLDRLERGNKKATSSFRQFRQALAVARDLVIVFPGAFRAFTAPLRRVVSFLGQASSAAADFEVTVQALRTQLALAGETNVPGVVAGLQDFASAIQNTTQFSDGLVLQVTQILTLLGVQQEDLRDATKAVLDYASATGRDAVQGAVQFGRTLSGLVGELGEAFPAIRELTAEQLKAGEAFSVAGQLLNGFSEEVAKTSRGIRSQFLNAFGDLQKQVGFAINPVIDTVVEAGTRAVRGLTGAIEGNQGELQGVVQGLLSGLLEGLRRAADFALDVPVLVARARVVFTNIKAFAIGAFGTVAIEVQRVFQQLEADTSGFLGKLALIPGLGQALGTSVLAFRAATAEATEEIKAQRAELDATLATLAEQAGEQQRAADAAKAAADAIRTGKDESSLLAQAWNTTNAFIDGAQANLQNFTAQERSAGQAIRTTNNGLSQRLAKLREANGVSFEAKQAVEEIATATRAATSNTSELAAAAREAADGFSEAAGSAGEVAAGTASDGDGSPGSSRRKGGSAGLDLSNAFSALSALRAQERALRGVRGPAETRAARLTTERIREAARAQTDQAIADFSSDVLQELNRAGVTDPTQRSSILNQRIAEAERLGVIPSRRSLKSSFTFG